MYIPATVKCDVCGIVKKPADTRWLLLKYNSDTGISASPYEKGNPEKDDAVCSEKCLSSWNHSKLQEMYEGEGE